MVIQTQTLVETQDWRIEEIFTDGCFSHYVIKQEMATGHSSTPFDEVKATGGLLKLYRNGETSATYTGVIDGSNKYKSDTDAMPKKIFNQLKAIGPY